MKRIWLALMFAIAVVMTGVLASAESQDGGLAIRWILAVVIATLVIWKVRDFWLRHRDQNDLP